MEKLEQALFNNKFLDNWYNHYYKLEAYLKQNSAGQFLDNDTMDDKLIILINIQSKIKNMLPAELRSKLAALNFDLDEKINIWEHWYGQLASFVQKNGHTNLPTEEKYEVLKDWLLRQIQGRKYLSDSQFRKLDELGVNWNLIFTRDQRWEQMYLKLKEFYDTFGHSQVPQKWVQDQSLANWVGVQRRMRAAQKLRPDRENRLHNLNFIWHIKDVFNAQWQHGYQELKLFYQTHGHFRVPGKKKQLTSWIENQRTAKRNNLLLAEREQQLNAIGFIWSFKDIKQTQWDINYQALCAFKQKYKHCFVPVKYKENKTLGNWVASQRKLEAMNQLAEAKKKKLTQLGFVWSSSTQIQLQSTYDAQWDLNFERLKIYQQVYGTCQVSLKLNPVLQRWTRWQRLLFYEGRLSKERLAKLNEIRFPWNIQEAYWMKMYEALTSFKKQFGHTRVPHQWALNLQLASWVYRLKVMKSELTAQKIELLNMIAFDWNLKIKTVVSWDSMYNRLLSFKQEYGHTRVPVKWPQDPKLGKWVSRMRQEKDKLYPERLALLNSLAFDWGYQFA